MAAINLAGIVMKQLRLHRSSANPAEQSMFAESGYLVTMHGPRIVAPELPP
jgi:hypothetical protein